MKRAVLLIILMIACVSGFLFSGGVLPWTPASGSGVESALNFIFQNQYSVVYGIVFFLLLSSILYHKELGRLVHAVYLKISGPPTAFEVVYTEPELTARIKHTEEKMADTEEALNKFSSAIEKYAAHLASHTGAIRGLNAASQELHKGAAQQNRVLMRLMENVDNPPAAQKKVPHWKIDPAPPESPTAETPVTEPMIEKADVIRHPVIPREGSTSYIPGCARNRRKKPDESLPARTDSSYDISPKMPEDITIAPESLENVQKYVADLRAKAGTTRTRKTIAAEALAAEEEIMRAIKKLNARLDESEIQE